MNLSHVFLFALQGSSETKNGPPMIIFLVLMLFVFYFFMIRPQKKKEKEARSFRASLQKGEKIVTIGGVHGKIVEIQDTTFTIETEGGSKMKIEKVAVAHVVKDSTN